MPGWRWRCQRTERQPSSRRAIQEHRRIRPCHRRCVASWRAHDDSITGLALSADGLIRASGGLDSVVRCWRLPAAVLQRECVGHRSPVAAVALSPDGTLLASGGFGMHFSRANRAFNLAGHHIDHTMRIWLVATGGSSPPPISISASVT